MEPIDRVCGVQFYTVLVREAHVGEDIVLCFVHDGGELGELGPEPVGDLTSLGPDTVGVILGEGGGDEGRESAPTLVSRHTCYVVLVLVTFSSSHDGEEVGMKRYVVALEKEERDELAGITRKGSHQSQKVVNALILLNCDEGEFNEHRARGEAIAEVLRISARKVDRVKKRFVEEGMEAALGGRQGRRPSYVRKADGEFEARLVALSCAEPPQGHSQWSLRLLADRVVELGHIDSVSHETVRRVLKKTQSSRGGASAG